MAEATCSTCLFYRTKGTDDWRIEDGHGFCTRYPPSFVPGLDMTMFPPVKPSLWCGEHQPNEVFTVEWPSPQWVGPDQRIRAYAEAHRRFHSGEDTKDADG